MSEDTYKAFVESDLIPAPYPSAGLTDEELYAELRKKEAGMTLATQETIEKLADHIHRHRMLPPPFCEGCLDLAKRDAEEQGTAELKCDSPGCSWTTKEPGLE